MTNALAVFGGQIFAQGMRAALDTISAERMVHSQHAYFLRPGDPNIPILFEVDAIRDGKFFTTRRVVASQHGSAIFNTELSLSGSQKLSSPIPAAAR
jgi:acyl-CoA thioesterase-2